MNNEQTEKRKQEIEFAGDLEECMREKLSFYLKDCRSEKIKEAWWYLKVAFGIVWGEDYREDTI